MSAKRRFWTQERVEVLWAVMDTLKAVRTDAGIGKFWDAVAIEMTQRTGKNLTTKAICQIADKVHRANRPYPWDLQGVPTVTTPPSALVPYTPPRTQPSQANTAALTQQLAQLLVEVANIKREIVDIVEGRLTPTSPNIDIKQNQLWATRTRVAAANDTRVNFQVVSATTKEVTLEEVGVVANAGYVYKITPQRLVEDFALVGDVQPAPNTAPAAPDGSIDITADVLAPLPEEVHTPEPPAVGDIEITHLF